MQWLKKLLCYCLGHDYHNSGEPEELPVSQQGIVHHDPKTGLVYIFGKDTTIKHFPEQTCNRCGNVKDNFFNWLARTGGHDDHA